MEVRTRLESLNAQAPLFDIYTTTDHVKPLQPVNRPIADLVAAGHDFVVLSSFSYDRYLYARRLRGLSPGIYQIAERYEALLALPTFVELRPRYRSYAFSNPTLRIVRLPRP
jgi:hypothetical protein